MLTITTTYSLLVKTAAGCEDTASVTVIVYGKLYIPDSFAPAATEKIMSSASPGAALRLKEFSVFDRRGNKVFTANNVAKGWDGRREGTDTTADTSVYILLDRKNKGDVFLKGTVQLVR